MTARLLFGGYQPERSVHTRAARLLAAEASARSAGTIDLEVVAQITSTGRAAADLLTMTENGELAICYFSSSYLAGRVPELGVIDLPFEGADRDTIWRRLDGAAGRLLADAVGQRTGYELLAFWDNGLRHVSNGVRPLASPRDCEGLSIRTLDNAFHQAVFAALGFRPRFIDVKDLGEAVATRAIDAQENPLTNLVNFDLHKKHRFVSLTGHFFGVALLLANRAALRALSADDRAALDAAVRLATAAQRAYAAAEDAECLRLLKADGVAVLGADAIDMAGFRGAVASVVEHETARLDPHLLAVWRTLG
jgi:C4-dicarboxylate-binding protein DctP